MSMMRPFTFAAAPVENRSGVFTRISPEVSVGDHAGIPPTGEDGAPGKDAHGAWADFFGPPARAIESYPWARENYDLPEAYKGTNYYLSNVMIRMISQEDSFWITTMLPLKLEENRMAIMWNEWRFHDHLLDRVPEESVSRLITSERSENRAYMLRKGIAMLLEHGFAKTEQGRLNYRYNLEQIRNASIETMCLDAAIALLESDPYLSATRHNMRRRGPMTKAQFEDQMQREIDMWAITQKSAHGFETAFDAVSTRLKERGVQNGNMTIVPAGVIKYIAFVRPENTMNYLSGKAGGPTDNITGNSQYGDIHPSRGFLVGEGVPNFDPFFRDRTVGNFFYINQDSVMEIPPQFYRSGMAGTYPFSVPKNDYFLVTLQHVLENCGLFQPDSAMALTPLGALYFTDYSSWGAYARKLKAETRLESAAQLYPAFETAVYRLMTNNPNWQRPVVAGAPPPAAQVAATSGLGQGKLKKHGAVVPPPAGQQPAGPQAPNAAANAAVLAAAAALAGTQPAVAHGQPSGMGAGAGEGDPADLKIAQSAADQKASDEEKVLLLQRYIDAVREFKIGLHDEAVFRTAAAIKTLFELTQPGGFNEDFPTVMTACAIADVKNAKDIVAIIADGTVDNFDPACHADLRLPENVNTATWRCEWTDPVSFLTWIQPPDGDQKGALDQFRMLFAQEPPAHEPPNQQAVVAAAEYLLKAPLTSPAKVVVFMMYVTMLAMEGNQTEGKGRSYGNALHTVDAEVPSALMNGMHLITRDKKLKLGTRFYIKSLRHPQHSRFRLDVTNAMYHQIAERDSAQKPTGKSLVEAAVGQLAGVAELCTEVDRDFYRAFSHSIHEVYLHLVALVKTPAAQQAGLKAFWLWLAIGLRYCRNMGERREQVRSTASNAADPITRLNIFMTARAASVASAYNTVKSTHIDAIGNWSLNAINAAILHEVSNFEETYMDHVSQEEDTAMDQLKAAQTVAVTGGHSLDIMTMLDSMPITDGRFLQACLDHNVQFFLGAIGFRPYGTYEMGSMVHMAAGAGGELGNTFVGHPDVQLGDNVVQKMHYANFTMYAKSLVLKPHQAELQPNVYCRGYRFGDGHNFWQYTEEDRTKLEEGIMDDNDIFIIPVDMDYKPDGNFLDITGRYNPALCSHRSSEPMYPNAEMFAQFWGWAHAQEGVQTGYFDDAVPRYNTVCAQTHQKFFQHTGNGGGTFSRDVVDKGHWGPDVSPGCALVRKGSQKFLKPVDYLGTATILVMP